MTTAVEVFDSTDSTITIQTAIEKLFTVQSIRSTDRFVAFQTPGSKVVIAKITLPP